MKEYLVKIWVAMKTIFIGLGVTGRHFFMRNATQQYLADENPEARWVSPIVPEGQLNERSRMRLHVKIEDCIGCKQCEKACPVDCIYITTEKREKDESPIFASDGTAIKQRVVQFDIDMSLCCYCNLCTYPCPTVCILMTPEYEFAETSKENFLYRFAKEKPLQPAEKKEHEPAAAGA